MGGNSRQKKSSSSSSSSSVFSFFKSKGPQKGKYTIEESPKMHRVWPTDGVRLVAEPIINKKASDFIAKFHEESIAAAN